MSDDVYGPRADGKGLLLNNETLNNNTQELEQLRQELEEWKGVDVELQRAAAIYRETSLKYKQEASDQRGIAKRATFLLQRVEQERDELKARLAEMAGCENML